MARKRKAARQPVGPKGPREYDPADARLGPITSYKDIADEQEEYFLDQDKILFDDEPGTKRQRREDAEDEFLEASDEEILAGEDSDDDSDAEDVKRKKSTSRKKRADDDDDDDDEEGGERGEDDQGWWGVSKNEYYDGEVIETEDHALEEEAEARRLQKKQLSRMTAADFFDADEWGTSAGGADAAGQTGTDKVQETSGGAVVTVKMKTADEIDSMTDDERYRLLQSLYPEFDYMCDEFSTLEPVLHEYRKLADGKAGHTLEAVQYRVLACYLSTMALYFSLLMAPTRDNPGGPQSLMDPEELHGHEVMEYLVDSRETWEWVQRVQARQTEEKVAVEEVRPDEARRARMDRMEKERTDKTDKKKEKTDKTDKKDKKDQDKKKKRTSTAVSKEVEASIADLSAVLAKNKKKRAAAKQAARSGSDGSDSDSDSDAARSDFGEAEEMDSRAAEAKMQRKKSLGFYTSQIMQKVNKRADAGGQAGGDVDIPYRERLRDRQARLMAAATRRGQSAIQPGEELGGDDEEDDDKDDKDDKDDGEEEDENLQYYNSIVRAHRQKKEAKAARKAEAEAGLLDRVEPEMSMDQDGRRQLTWEIEKNKGLSHRTMKEKKNNPRVKKRIKFEKKTKQLASKRAVYKEVGDRNNYHGELTGIKTGLVRSIKLG